MKGSKLSSTNKTQMKRKQPLARKVLAASFRSETQMERY